MYTGARQTSGTYGVTAFLRPEDYQEDIYNVEVTGGNADAALFVLTNQLAKAGKSVRIVDDPKYHTMEKILRPRSATFAGTLTTLTISLTVSGGFENALMAGSILYVPSTGERMMVSGVLDAGNWVFVTRNLGGAITGGGLTAVEGDGAVTASGATVMLAGEGFAENTTAPSAISNDPEDSYNLCMIFKKTVELSKTLMNTKLRGGPFEAREVKEKALLFKNETNALYWTSVRRSGTDANGNAIRHTGGIFQHLRANTLDVSGTGYDGQITKRAWDAIGEKVFENGSPVKYAFGGLFLANVLNAAAIPYMRVDSKEESFGANMIEVKTSAGGVIRIVVEKKVFFGTMAQTVPILDLKYIRPVWLRNRQPKLEKNIKTDDGYDGVKHQWIAEGGIEFIGYGLDHTAGTASDATRSPHGKITGFTASP